MSLCRFCVCVHMLQSTWLGPWQTSERGWGGGPSALETSCTPQHQQLTTHLSAFMRVSSNSRAGCTPALPPCNSGSPHTEAGGAGGGRGGGGAAGQKLAEEDLFLFLDLKVLTW